MKIGDKLYCHTACYMRMSNKKTLTVGNFYTIIGVYYDDNEFYIIDDDGDDHFF